MAASGGMSSSPMPVLNPWFMMAPRASLVTWLMNLAARSAPYSLRMPSTIPPLPLPTASASMVPQTSWPSLILTYASFSQFSFRHLSQPWQMFALSVVLKSSGRTVENSCLPVQYCFPFSSMKGSGISTSSSLVMMFMASNLSNLGLLWVRK